MSRRRKIRVLVLSKLAVKAIDDRKRRKKKGGAGSGGVWKKEDKEI